MSSYCALFVKGGVVFRQAIGVDNRIGTRVVQATANLPLSCQIDCDIDNDMCKLHVPGLEPDRQAATITRTWRQIWLLLMSPGTGIYSAKGTRQ